MAHWERLRQIGQDGLALTFCVLLCGAPAWGQGMSFAASSKSAKPINEQERVLHALNRLTFGPRPGDVAAVEKTGLNRWFEQQLDPAKIDDSSLEVQLAQWPAMRLSIGELEAKYPGPQQIRQMIAGKLDITTNPEERTRVEDQIALYKLQKAKQEAAKGVGVPAWGDAANKMAPDAAFPHADVMKLASLAPEERVRTILAMQPEELMGLRQALRGGKAASLTAGLTPGQRETLEALGGSDRMVSMEAMESRVTRDIDSNRQLEAVMTDFWLNHFNVYVKKNQNEPALLPTYERETIRPNALGNFEQLLAAVAMSPAMLEYLDNFRSIGPDSQAAQRKQQAQALHPNAKGSEGLNENYGRELMELHTVGVNGGYTQADVTNVAKVFTGWTIDRPDQAGGGTFVFNEWQHEPGSKTVLGQSIQEDGMKEGLEVLHMLATSPATAHFICQKLAVRFVSDNPPPALVNRMAKSFLLSHGDIKTVLRTMWRSPEFWTVGVERAKVKTPEEFVISAVRASGAQVKNPEALVTALDRLGMPLYGMQTPNGYSWSKDDWVSTGALVSRMNFSLVLAAGKIPGTSLEWSGVLDQPRPAVVRAGYPGMGAGADWAAPAEKRLETVLLGGPVGERTRATVLAQANDATVTQQAETQFDLRGGPGTGGGKRQAGVAQVPVASAAGDPRDAQLAVMAGLLLGSPEFQRR